MTEQKQSIWGLGVPLIEAMTKFGPAEYSAEFLKLRVPPLTVFGNALQSMLENKPDAAEKMRAAQENTARYISLYHFLGGQVQEKLQQGKLVAVGFAAPREPTDAPMPIPSDLWEGKIDWEKSSAKSNGIEFFGIRVIDPSAGQIEVQTAQQGRRSSKAIIESVFEALLDEGQIDFTKSQSAHFDLVRQRAQMQNPNLQGGEGLNEKTLYKYLGPLFRSRKPGP
jgi:hypothetical protein